MEEALAPKGADLIADLGQLNELKRHAVATDERRRNV
jgi:hypothetical protein